MKREDLTVGHFTYRLKHKNPISFVRFGDGEIMCMREGLLKIKARAKNCDKHPYTFPLALELRHVLATPSPTIHYGLQNCLAKLMGLSQEDCEKAVDELAPDVTWFNGDIFHQASTKGQLGEFSKALFDRHPVMVGPPIFRRFPIKCRLIEIPALNCHSAADYIKKSIWDLYHAGARTFSVSASMPAKHIIHTMASLLPGASFLDMGSVWDPYCGTQSRRYHKGLSEDTLKRNLGL